MNDEMGRGVSGFDGFSRIFLFGSQGKAQLTRAVDNFEVKGC